MIEVKRGRKWVTTKTIPQKLGSIWRTERYVHGPRIRQPREFERIYVFDIKRAQERHIPLVRKPKHVDKVKWGPLKKSGKPAVQSYLTVRSHMRRGSFIRGYRRRKSICVYCDPPEDCFLPTERKRQF